MTLEPRRSDSERESLYGIAGRAAGEAALEHGRDGIRLRKANDAFLLSRIARAIVDAIHPPGAESEVERLRQALIPFAFIGRASMERLGLAEEYDEARRLLGLPPTGDDPDA